MIDRVVQVGDRYGMCLNVGKTKVMRIGRQVRRVHLQFKFRVEY